MVTEFGMSDVLGPMRYGQAQGEVFLGRDLASTPDYSDAVAARIDAEVQALIDAAHVRARDLLAQYRGVLDRLVVALLEHETLDADSVGAILADVTAEDAPGLGGARPSALGITESGRPE